MSSGEVVRNFYRNQGAEAERERIIKLLTEMSAKATNHETRRLFFTAIEAIKGETE